jgi:hypothetical protein
MPVRSSTRVGDVDHRADLLLSHGLLLEIMMCCSDAGPGCSAYPRRSMLNETMNPTVVIRPV